ncbi:hypothetical protein ACFOMD_02715 [Sphingoaurantiacus capsulatus]|uniref:Uncharacterized protein n=1 Tax=Sphingoaurantiacus capsulatus TaxID=1771310 RepID=A0ABV7X5P3_9SPHN
MQSSRRLGTPWMLALWAPPALLVLIPLIAMQLSSEMAWSPGDFLAAALLGLALGGGFELATRSSGSTAYRAAAALALLAGLGLVWVNLAVGIVGSEGNPANLLFMLIPLLALIGTAIARLRPRGMAWAMAVTGVAQLLLAGVAPFSAIFALPWFASAWLFRKAARD